tara:strand:- start:650 stop:835 length:186 start_codon:yes stop_codon:yes gene_type:complete
MNFFKSPFLGLNQKRKEIDYIKSVYKRRVQAEIESYNVTDKEDKNDTIKSQDILMVDKISI